MGSTMWLICSSKRDGMFSRFKERCDLYRSIEPERSPSTRRNSAQYKYHYARLGCCIAYGAKVPVAIYSLRDF